MKIKKQISFEHSYKSIFVWFLSTYFIFGILLPILRDFSLKSITIDNVLIFEPTALLVKLNVLLCFFLFLYFSYLAFYKFYPTLKILLVLGILGALFIPILLRFIIDQRILFWLFGETNYLPNTTFNFYFSDNTYFAVYYMPSGILYYFYMRNKSLQKARIEAERQRALAELNHLRSQINPHFLFNSLNNIYALAYEKSDKILGAIEGLSELLRYALYEKGNFVPFETEWSKALQMIKIEKMRLMSPVEFKINISEEVSDILIPPVILLPLIENVFKHGVVQDSKIPPQVNAFIENNTLKIKIENHITPFSQKDKQTGIGLENIKKRLFHAYGENASFAVLEKDDTFRVQFSIPVK